MPNCLSLLGISIKDGEKVGVKQDDGSIRYGFYDQILGAVVWTDDFTNSPTDHLIMIGIERWLEG